MKRMLPCAVLASLALAGCAAPAANPPAPGFNADGSDPRAMALADRTMQAMGGRAAWDATRFLAWDFFGARRHVWDRHTGRVRIEGAWHDPAAPFVVLMNIETREGRAWLNGTSVPEVQQAEWMQRGYEMWVNDSYWLVMPYKLKDTGVTLRDGGSATLEDGRAADVVTLTFEGVGVTPQNRYDVCIARDTGLVVQWSYYADVADPAPKLTTPWNDWRRYGSILLSGDRGDRKISDIAVAEQLPDAVFEDPAPIAWPLSAD